MSIATFKQALERIAKYPFSRAEELTVEQMREIARQAIEQAKEQEPANLESWQTHLYQGADGEWKHFIDKRHYENTVADGSWPIVKLYTHAQPQRPVAEPHKWVGLTDEERGQAWSIAGGKSEAVCIAIESKLKEKNT